MPYDADATRERLLSTAVEEFSAWGLAGGRVDRIAEAAAANKRAIYDYFGDKEGLFSAALNRVVNDLNAATPLIEDDLPEYAGRLFDYLHAHPEAVRMNAWARLERPQLIARLEPRWIANVPAIGRSSDGAIGAADLIVLVIGLANAWFLSASVFLPGVGEVPDDPGRLAAHRETVVTAVRRLSAG